jgi:DNA-binding transcriptional LysR family regulator
MELISYVPIFVKVVRCKSFTRAAEELDITRPLVSRRIKELEDSLGVHLLNRTTRTFSLTEAGEIFYERCVEILGNLDETEQTLHNLSGEPRGEVKISAPINWGQKVLSGVLGQVAAQNPALRFTIELTDQRINLVERGFDLAIRMGWLADSTLVARRLTTIRAVYAVSPDYLAKNGAPADPEELKSHNCLISSFFKRGGPLWPFNINGEEMQVRVHGTMEANNTAAMIGLAVAGQGVLFAPYFMIEDRLESGELVTILEEFESRDIGLYAVYTHKKPPAKIQVIVDALLAYYAE